MTDLTALFLKVEMRLCEEESQEGSALLDRGNQNTFR